MAADRAKDVQLSEETELPEDMESSDDTEDVELPEEIRRQIEAHNQYLEAQTAHIGREEFPDLASDDQSSDDGDPEWPWLKQLIQEAKRTVDGRVTTVAQCKGYVIDRDAIKSGFYTEMEGPEQGMADCAVTLFDNRGRLKAAFKKHAIKKGTGVWGNELDHGCFVYIDFISVKKDFRRQRIASNLAQQLWQRAKASYPQAQFAITLATHLNTGYDPIRLLGMSDIDYHNTIQQSVTSAVAFWRSVGFRRIGNSQFFALAADPNHPANNISASSDYDPPNVEFVTEPLPVHDALVEIRSDEAMVAFLEEHLAKTSPTHASWRARNSLGNTILHIFMAHKPRTLDWILEKPWLKDLLAVQNNEGYTPEESFVSRLDDWRAVRNSQGMVIDVSDDFTGFKSEHIDYLFKLRGIATPSEDEWERATYGCTCGECIAGFLSPRVAHALRVRAEIDGDELRTNLHKDPLLFLHSTPVKRLPPATRALLVKELTCREGFTRLFKLITTCLDNKKLPTRANICAIMDANNQNDTHARSFLEAAKGSVDSVVESCFLEAMDEDDVLGNGALIRRFLEKGKIDRLPEFRNDGEFRFALNQYLGM